MPDGDGTAQQDGTDDETTAAGKKPSSVVLTPVAADGGSQMQEGRAAVEELQATYEGQIATAARELMDGAPPHIKQVVLLLVGTTFARRHFPDEKERPTLLNPPYLDSGTKQQLVQELEERLAAKIRMLQAASPPSAGVMVGVAGVSSPPDEP
jgi:hypothetical protein